MEEEELIEVVMVSRKPKAKRGDVVRIVWLEENSDESLKNYIGKMGVVSSIFGKEIDVEFPEDDDIPYATFVQAELEVVPDDKVNVDADIILDYAEALREV